MSLEEVIDKLDGGVALLNFYMVMCSMHFGNGRLLMFEHFAGAWPWQTEVVRQASGLPGSCQRISVVAGMD